MMHVYGDPLKYRDLESKIAVEKFNSAIILCDAAWVDPDQVDPLSPTCETFVSGPTAGFCSDIDHVILMCWQLPDQ